MAQQLPRDQCFRELAKQLPRDQCFRELAKTLCASMVRYILESKETGISNISIDVPQLVAWASNTSPEVIEGLIDDDGKLRAALGHNNFCMDIVTATKSSQRYECE